MSELLCCTIINNVMPSVRAALSVRMLEQGFRQSYIAEKLGTTQPAIAQYKKQLRGSLSSRISRNKHMLRYIDALITDITGKNADINTRVCEICGKAREYGVLSVDRNRQLCLLELNGVRKV